MNDSKDNTPDTETLIKELEEDILHVDSLEQLKKIQEKYLGKKGLVKKLFNEIKSFSGEEKIKRASLIQRLQKKSNDLIKEKEVSLKKDYFDIKTKEEAESLDISVPKVGHLHPITHTIRALNDVFERMGYSVLDGPELETDEYCFQRLNVPEDHPARDMQDTIYVESPNVLLRTQVSSVEARALERHKPPFKMVSPGRVYRNEKTNKSNHFIFHHYQGVAVMEKVTMKDLFGAISCLFKSMYGPDVKYRFRNKYYPEVEPGVGPDMLCFNCKGKGCVICKNVGWIEMGGAGIIHPNVLKQAGIDEKKWMGFAFGMGLDRCLMAKYKITDIRTLLGGDLAYKYYENENTL